MNKLFVKICGITRPQDAELAAGLGASALGFVFWPGSPRAISAQTAKSIVENVPAGVLKVGVFVDQTLEEVARIMNDVGLDVAQLHGRESPDFCRALMVRLKADTTVATRTDETRTDETRTDETRTDETPGEKPPGERPLVVSGFSEKPLVVSGFSRTVIKAVGMTHSGSVNIANFDPEIVLLVDAHDSARFGGTGRTVNWDAARELAARRRTILAGGLNATNVKLAVRTVRPYGVDLSSGVESAPGVKDANRLRTFFEALHD